MYVKLKMWDGRSAMIKKESVLWIDQVKERPYRTLLHLLGYEKNIEIDHPLEEAAVLLDMVDSASNGKSERFKQVAEENAEAST